jgi:hypothetical protein
VNVLTGCIRTTTNKERATQLASSHGVVGGDVFAQIAFEMRNEIVVRELSKGERHQECVGFRGMPTC